MHEIAMTTVVAIENHRVLNQIVTDEINTDEDLAIRAVANWRSIPYK
jgi:hypothetical protein